MNSSSFTRSLLLICGIAALSGCNQDRSSSPDAVATNNVVHAVPDSAAGSEPAEEADSVQEPARTPVWREVDARELTPEQNEAFRRAVSARTGLGAKLIGTLTESIQKDGPAAAVHVCRDLAPGFAVEVGQQYGVAVGRSSTRLRNASNLPPAWATEIIAKGEAEEVLLVGPDNRVGTLTPIFTGELCTRCHGPADTIAPDVLAAIQQDYPTDQATGYNAGDLRGWFWVEAPIATAPPVYYESDPNRVDEAPADDVEDPT